MSLPVGDIVPPLVSGVCHHLSVTLCHSSSAQASDPTQIVVSSTNTGAVQIVNSAFWGPSNRIARVRVDH